MANAAGADIMVATNNAATSCVNSVNTNSSDVFVSAVGLFPWWQVGLPTVQLTTPAHASQGPTKTGYYPDIFATVLENPHDPPFCSRGHVFTENAI